MLINMMLVEELTLDEVLHNIDSINDIECDCDACKSMCKRPCWGTPDEILKLIELGYAERLMLDYWVGNFTGRVVFDDYEADTHIICPAEHGHEAKYASSWRDASKCTFQTKSGLCELHNICKPVEGRKGNACDQDKPDIPEIWLHQHVARLWDTDKGRKIVEDWKKLVKVK